MVSGVVRSMTTGVAGPFAFAVMLLTVGKGSDIAREEGCW